MVNKIAIAVKENQTFHQEIYLNNYLIELYAFWVWSCKNELTYKMEKKMSQLNALHHDDNQLQVETYEFEPIKGYPRLNWKGKRPFSSTHYYPAQLKESYGEPVDGWMNEIYWGDNLQVMSHLLKKYRGKIKLIYIDPPFDSRAEYKKSAKLKEKIISNDHGFLEEKQYNDIWINDEYLQYMYDRLIILKELLSNDGSICLHCDWHKSHYLRCVLDEIYGEDNFVNEIIWQRKTSSATKESIANSHDTIFYFSKNGNPIFNQIYSEYSNDYIGKQFIKDEDGRLYRRHDVVANPALGGDSPKYEYRGYIPKTRWLISKEKLTELDKQGKIEWSSSGRPYRKLYLDELEGQPLNDVWCDIPIVLGNQKFDYPTQKPEKLLERIIQASSNPGDIVFDCFMGFGTTQAVAMKLGRRFIGADINAGAIQTTIKRLINTADELKSKSDKKYYTGFAVYNVNQYDIFRNELEAKDLIIEALGIERLNSGSIFDGTKDEFKVKIMPINRIATRKDVSDLVNNLDYKNYEKSKLENPMKIVDNIMLVCMGHEPELAAHFKKETEKYRINLKVYDILREGAHLTFKRDSEADIEIKNNILEIKQFYPTMLLEKLRKQNETVIEYRELVESVMIDPHYDGAVFTPTIKDIPGKHEFIKGRYELPADHGRVAIKITDLLSETFFTEVGQLEKEDLYV